MVLPLRGHTGFVTLRRMSNMFQVRVAKGICVVVARDWHGSCFIRRHRAGAGLQQPQGGGWAARVNRIGTAATFAEIVNQENRL